MIQLPITEKRLVAENTHEVSFDISGKEFSFIAGQYIQVAVPKLLYPDPKGSYRVFSIVSSPNDKNKISVAFRDSGSGFKKTLLEMPLGSSVEISSPSGFFTLSKNTEQPVVFIAGGIGITPCLSIIRYCEEEKVSFPITLLYANRNKESSAYSEEFEEMTKRNHNFFLKNKFGKLDESFIKESINSEIDKIKWYVVGPTPMVAEVKELLFKLGADGSKIYLEEFVGI